VVRARHGVVHERGADELAAVVVHGLLQHGLTDAHGDRAVHLAGHDGVVDWARAVLRALGGRGRKAGGRDTLAGCQRVMMEYNFAPLYSGQPSFAELFDAMKDLEFLFEGFIQPLRHPRTLEMLSADLIFYKPGHEVA